MNRILRFHAPRLLLITGLLLAIASSQAQDPKKPNLPPAPQPAQPKPPAIFSDHMVLQRDIPVPVWGTATPGDQVSVSIAGQTKTTQAGLYGKWMVRLDPLATSAEPLTMKIAIGTNEITFSDVLVGEVWLASGQSNMEMPVGNVDTPARRKYPGVDHYEEELKNASHPLLRLCLVDRPSLGRPSTHVSSAGWKACSPESVNRFSAVGYFYGRHLVETLKVPVGIIQCACSSSQAEQWISLEVLSRFPQFAAVTEYCLNPEFLTLDNADYQNFAPKVQPSGLFNGGLAPIIPYAIRGAIWYQGESNADRAVEYRSLFPAMIADWRQRWGEGDFPFYFVQLAGFGDIPTQPRQQDGWAELREAQTMTLSTPNTGMAVTIDIGMPDFIHPLNKQEVGRRLGLVAQAKTYGAKLESSGPAFQSMKIDGPKVVVQFEHLGGGLVSRNPADPKKLSNFSIAGQDGLWKWADARIEGDSVVVSCESVKEPVAVRYAWSGNIACDFYNKDGLPALPFRTDDWKLTTEGKVYQPGDLFLNAIKPPPPAPKP